MPANPWASVSECVSASADRVKPLVSKCTPTQLSITLCKSVVGSKPPVEPAGIKSVSGVTVANHAS